MQNQINKVAQLTGGKKRAFFALMIFLPILLFIGLEFSLRLFGYGSDIPLFGRQEIRGKIYRVMNPGVKSRYFGSTPFAPSTSIHYFLVPKPDGVFRIFCLGGSTTVGYPYFFNASFPSLLDERLAALFPQKNIEVINLGITATNSYTTLDIVRDLMDCQPDLIIVYDGHNEFYGALGAASNRTPGSARFITLLYLRLVHLRTFQLLQNGIHKFTSMFGHEKDSNSDRTVMEDMAYGQYIPYGSDIYNSAYSIFTENLKDLKNYCSSKGVPLILGTQVSNLRDQPPFVSGNSPGLPQSQQTLFQNYYKTGLELKSRGLLDSAIFYFRSAIAVDSLYADAHYRLAQCFDSIKMKHDALCQYMLARDYDELRFRTDSKFNDLIRSMNDSGNCYVADVEKGFKSLSRDSLIGHGFITEHLHPTSWGNFLIAKCYSRIMREHSLIASQREWGAADTLRDDRLWQNRCITDLDERMAAQSIKFLTSRWPFKMQSHAPDPVPPGDTLDLIAQKLTTGHIGWLDAHRYAIDYYIRRGDWKSAAREYRTIISMYPHFIESYLELAAIYFQNRRFDEMKDILLGSLKISPTLLAYNALGNIMMDKRNPAEAIKYFERTDDFPQTPGEKLQNGFALGRAYAMAGEYEKARMRLIRLLDQKPDFKPALELLAFVNKQINKH